MGRDQNPKGLAPQEAFDDNGYLHNEVNFVTTFRFAALAAFLLFSTAAVSAQAATDAPAVQPAPLRAAQDNRDPNRIICKREDVIGSRLGGAKTCHTWADWQEMARDAKDAANAAQAMSSHSNPTGGH